MPPKMNIDDLKLKALPGVSFEVSMSALEKWDGNLKAKAESNNTISILDVIGEDYFGEGFTDKRCDAALRSIGEENDVEVIINSPGGSMWEGLAIYNMLRQHKGKVTVKVIGIAASAASIIAMAGDEIQVSESGFLMIHNSWLIAIGNRHDFRDTADVLEPFDQAMARIYANKSGKDMEEVMDMMDKETFINGHDAVEQGLADSLLDSDEVKKDNNANSALRKVDTILAKHGVPRSERRKLFNEMSATPSAGDDSTPSAGKAEEEVNLLSDLINVLNKGK